MKRIACPACGKPLLVPAGIGGKPIKCPTCKKQLEKSVSGLIIPSPIRGQMAAPEIRPIRPMVPLTAPVREKVAKLPNLAPPVPSRTTTTAKKFRRPRWFVSVTVGAGFLLSMATAVVVFRVVRTVSKPRSSVETHVELSLTKPRGRDGQPTSEQRRSHDGAGLPLTRRLVAENAVNPGGGGSEDPVQDVLRSVAVIAVPGEGHGSGFVVAPGMLVTNYHVIEDAVIRDLQITFPDDTAMAGRGLRAELIHLSVSEDLAFLAIEPKVRPLALKARYEHVNGQRVVAVGSPGTGDDGPTLENLTTDGRLGPELALDNDCKRWALSMAVNGGNSGGPLVDAQTGEVIGVIVAKFTQTESQSLAIPYSTLMRELAKAKQASKETRLMADSLHRQRYCLRQMAAILGVTSFAFDRSIAAAVANSCKGGAAMDAAFNESKTEVAAVFAEQFADFSATVGGEVEGLQDDSYCDTRVRRGLRKLMSDIEEQAVDIRRRVPSDEIATFLGRFRGSVQGSRDLVAALSELLHMEIPTEED